MAYNSHSYVINHVNLTLGNKIPQTTILYTKTTHKLIYFFYKLGCINNFFIHNRAGKAYISFSVLFYKNSPFFKSVRLVSSPARRHTITYRALRIANQSLGSSILILSTTQGLLTHQDALKLQLGGLVLAVLN